MTAEDNLDGVASCLHCLMSDEAGTLQACLAHCAPGDSLVLMSTALNLLLDPEWKHNLIPGVAVYALAADAAAQGMLEISPDCEFIDDQQWARLVMHHPHSLSWK